LGFLKGTFFAKQAGALHLRTVKAGKNLIDKIASRRQLRWFASLQRLRRVRPANQLIEISLCAGADGRSFWYQRAVGFACNVSRHDTDTLAVKKTALENRLIANGGVA